MPKVIDGLQSSIIQSVRKRLFSAPPSFSLRAVAKDCGIAVGTIYNYFPDKETLIASVFAEDWALIIAETEAGISRSESMEDGIRAVYSGLVRFTQSHETVWKTFGISSGIGTYYRKGHKMLTEQIERLLKTLFSRFGHTADEAMFILMAELLISASQHAEFSEEEIMRVLIRFL
jgi:AcrR family transcriptional regulator